MTSAQTRMALAKIAKVDGRTVDDEAVLIWSKALAHSEFIHVMQAITTLSTEATPMTPRSVMERASEMWAQEAMYAPNVWNAENRDDFPAHIPANFYAMSDAWDDPVEFARQRRVYQDQLDATGYLGPEVS